MTLGELLAGSGRPTVLARARVVGPDDVRVDDVVIDSRSVTQGSLFCCVRGASFDGHSFAADAVAANCASASRSPSAIFLKCAVTRMPSAVASALAITASTSK